MFNTEKIIIETDKKYKHLIPKYPQYHTKFTIETDYVVANGIRRIICNSIPIKRMYFDHKNFETNDKRIIPQLIQDRIRSISIGQDTEFKLYIDISNDSDEVIHVTTNDIKGVNKPKMNNMIICDLQPRTKLKITNIVGITEIGRVNGKHCETSRVTSYEADEKGKYIVAFYSNGMIHPKIIINTALNILINKFNKIKSLVNNITIYPSQDIHDYPIYKLSINNEDDTVGTMLMKRIIDLNPTILNVRYDLDETIEPPGIVISIRSKNNNISSIISSSCDSLIFLLNSFILE